MAKRRSIPLPSKEAQKGLVKVLEYLRDEQYNYHLDNTSDLFLHLSAKEVAEVHAAIDWIYLGIQKMEE